MSRTKHNDSADWAAARAYHPSVRPIWTPDDSVATAEDFHAEMANAERGLDINEPWFMAQSRKRRARLMDGLAVGLLLALMACLGVILFAASAKADPDSDAVAYASEYGGTVCSVLDDGHNTIAGLTGIMLAIQKHGGLTAFQSGEVVGLSVAEICPRYTPLLRQFVTRYGKAAIA